MRRDKTEYDRQADIKYKPGQGTNQHIHFSMQAIV